MFDAIFGKKQKRLHQRRETPFKATWTLAAQDEEKSAIGLDASAGGLGFLSKEKIPADEFAMRFNLDGRIFTVRVKTARVQEATFKGEKVWRYGVEFIAIPADDWDAVVRWTKGGAVEEPDNRARREVEMVRMSPDDAARLMPKAIQDRMLNGLVRRGRLAPLSDMQPLVQYFYGGLGRRKGRNVHQVSILSRVTDGLDQKAEFKTTFYLDEDGQQIEMAD